MSQTPDPKPALSPDLFWRVLLAGNVMSLGVLLLVFNRMMSSAVAPLLGYVMLAVGLFSVLPAVLYQQRGVKRLSEAQSDNARQRMQFNQVVINSGLAELPGVLGCLYYLFNREWSGTLLLLALTVMLLLQARPRS
jgi:hypothetical protein